MPVSTNDSIRVGIRGSRLSLAQFHEVAQQLPSVALEAVVIATPGDRDRTTSLRDLERSDFFTRDIDEALLRGACRLAVHSAKDLPDPVPKGLVLAALTRGVDSSDALVLRPGRLLEDLPAGARIGTSSFRRELAVRRLRHDLSFIDVRGDVDDRLRQLDRGAIDGLVVAEAALIRLGETHRHRIRLECETAPAQGQLALVTGEGDVEMRLALAPLDARPLHRVLYTGLDARAFSPNVEFELFHYPTIRTTTVEADLGNLADYTHVILTSKSGVDALGERMGALSKTTFIAVGRATALGLKGFRVLVAQEESAEGVVSLLEGLDLRGARVLWPHSALSRPLISDYLKRHCIDFHAPVVYETHHHQPFKPPSLECIDELVFTSPSTVDGFLRLYRALPFGKTVTALGPVTRAYLQTKSTL